jgi:CxxC motif-containing protein (DUF1111 family)
MTGRRWRRARAILPAVALAIGLALAGSGLVAGTVAADDAGPTSAPGAPPELVDAGAALFANDFTAAQGLGPFFNGSACASCHVSPRIGGMGREGLAVVTRIGRYRDGGGFDPLLDRGGPVARSHAILGLRAACLSEATVPQDVDIRSVRNTPALFGMGLIDQIPDDAILALAVPHDGGVNGHANIVTDAGGQRRVGKFGWKADTASLEQFVAEALRNEHGITNPLAPSDLVPPGGPVAGCPGGPADASAPTEDDGSTVAALAAFVASLPAPAAEPDPVGERLFAQVGCASCHTPSLPTAGGGEARLYSDLLLHDMGPGLDDAVVQGQATRRDWRTTPLWGLRERQRFLHDGRARSIEAAIGAHSGEASTIAHRYADLPVADRAALLHFLETR